MWSLRKIGHYTLVSGLAAAVGFNIALFTMQTTPSQSTPALVAVLATASPTGTLTTGMDQEVLRFDLVAVNADFTVSKITIAKAGACAKTSTGPADLKIFDAGSLTLLASVKAPPAVLSQNQFAFQNFSTPLVVPAGVTKTFSVTGDTTACTGTVKFSIPNKGVVATYLKPTTAYVGNLKGSPLIFSAPSQPAPSTAGQASLTAALSPDSAVGTIDVGFMEVLRFTLTATGSQDVVTNTFNFKPVHSCPSLTNPKATLFELGDELNAKTVSNLSGSEITANGFSVKDFSRAIKAGSSKTFVLKFDATGCGQSKNFRMDFVGGKWYPYNSDLVSTMISGVPLQGNTIIIETP